MSDEINYPTGFGLKDIVAWGSSGMVCLDEPSQTVIKSPHGEENLDEIAVERKIYERFSEHGGHEGLLHYNGPYESGIRIEYARNGSLRSFLKTRGDIRIEQRLRWAEQISNALRFVHSVNVIHGDVTCSNILLDGQLNAKLSDFGGSSLDGSPLLIGVTASHRSPGTVLSTQGDMFALGSTIYEIIQGCVPYHELPEEEIEVRYSKDEFPDTKFLGPIGNVITRCWRCQYNNFDNIITDIGVIQKGKSPSTNPALVLLTNSTLITIATVGIVAFLIGTKLAHRWNWFQK